MSYALYKTANFGPGKAGLATVGYTLTGGSRITAGVAEVGTSTGAYGATVTFADGFAGSILWDTGQGGSTAYAAEEVNPVVLAPTGLDAIAVTDPGGVSGHTTLPRLVVAVYRRFFRKATRTATQLKTYADDGTTVNTTQAVSDDGSGNESQGAAA